MGLLAMALSLNACIIVRSDEGDTRFADDGDFPDDRFDDDFGGNGGNGGRPDPVDRPDDRDADRVRQLFEPLRVTALPDPTNAFADDPAAARFGERLFNDKRYSSDGTIACASCHEPSQGFSDTRQFSPGVGGAVGTRSSPGIVNPGLQTWVLWDGKADSLWSQPVMAMENPIEMNLKRTQIAHLTVQNHADEYEEVFGELPNLIDIPTAASPGDLGWDRMTAGEIREVEGVVANVGKAIAAFERTITCENTRFDRFLEGGDTLTRQEVRGALLFEEVGCVECHSGPNFTDNDFHNIGIGSSNAAEAEGRIAVWDSLFENPFAGDGAYSDDTGAGRAKLATVADEFDDRGMFKTPSLRGVTQRPRYMHNGSFDDVRRVVQFYASPDARQEGSVGEVASIVRDLRATRDEQDDITAFLGTLECP
jgi:cytochrome c peroxidase